MLLNLSIISEELGNAIIESSISQNIDLDLDHANLYSSEISNIDSDTLYILNESLIEEFESVAPSQPFAIISPYDAVNIHKNLDDTHYWILFDESISVAQSLTLINSIFRKYHDWESRIYFEAAHHAPLQDILSICDEPLVNPFALFDTFSNLLGIGGEPPKNPDIVWDTIQTRGYYPIEMSPADIERTAYTTKTPIYVRVNSLDMSMAVFVLCLDGKPVANAGTTEVNGPITTGQLSLLYAIQAILEKSNVLEFLLSYSRYSMSYPLQCLLRGNAIDKSVVDYALARWNCSASDTFQVLFCFSDGNSKMEENEKLDLSQRLDRIMADSTISPFDDGVVVILRHPLASAEELMLTPLLMRRSLRCAVSIPFSPISYLRFAYLQCRFLMTLPDSYETYPLSRFSEHYEELVLNSMISTTSLEPLCDPAILKLSMSEHGKEFVYSLKIYLLNGRNISESARKLFVHRNTLLYRINRMETLLGIDLGEADESVLFRVLLSCIIVEHLSQADAT